MYSLINVCHQIQRDVGEISFKESFRVYTCYYRRSVISSFDCIKKYGFNFAQQIVPSQECVPLPVGNELNHVEVRERCVIELALYSAYYLADEKLVNRIAALRALQFKRDF